MSNVGHWLIAYYYLATYPGGESISGYALGNMSVVHLFIRHQ